MKIEYFTDSYLPGMGGTEMAVVSLCKSLKDKHQVAVACPKYKTAPEDLGWPVFLCKSIMVKKPQSYCAFSSLDKSFKTKIVLCCLLLLCILQLSHIQTLQS